MTGQREFTRLAVERNGVLKITTGSPLLLKGESEAYNVHRKFLQNLTETSYVAFDKVNVQVTRDKK